MYLLTVGVILLSEPVIDVDSAIVLIPDFALANVSLIDIVDSVIDLKKLTTLLKLSLIDIDSLRFLYLSEASVIISVMSISPPLTVSKTFVSKIAESNNVLCSTMLTVL